MASLIVDRLDSFEKKIRDFMPYCRPSVSASNTTSLPSPLAAGCDVVRELVLSLDRRWSKGKIVFIS